MTTIVCQHVAVLLPLLLLLLLLQPHASHGATVDHTLIVGGTGATVGQFPAMVSLQTAAQRHFCGGTIISTRWLLTAAHCVFDRWESAVRVRSGTLNHNHGGQLNMVNIIRVHEQFVNQVNRYNDIAAVQIVGQFANSALSQPISVDVAPALGVVAAQAIGWGQTSLHVPGYPDVLQTITTATLSDSDCLQQAAIPAVVRVQICALAGIGRGICTGDTGGPLVVEGRLVGIASSAVPCATGRPDVYTRVSAFAHWIAATAV